MTREYTGYDGPGIRQPGTDQLARRLEQLSAGRLIRAGTYVVRDKRGPGGVLVGNPSVHGTGRAADLSRRTGYRGLPGCDRERFELYLAWLVDHADEIGLELLLDYEGFRAWKCDRAEWRDWSGGGAGADWLHLELDPEHAASVDWVEAFAATIPQLDYRQPPNGGLSAVNEWPAGQRHFSQTAKPSSSEFRRAVVILYQTALEQHGYQLAADGHHGPLTASAVVSFQLDHPPLDADGVVGPQTWAVLFAK